MAKTSSENDIRFDVILAAADSRDHLLEQLDTLEHLSQSVNERLIGNLISDTENIQLDLNSTILFNEKEANQLSNLTKQQVSQTESIISIPTKLAQYIDDPSHYDDALQLLEQAHELNKLHGDHVAIIRTIYNLTKRQHDNLTTNLCNQLFDLKESNQEELKKLVHQLIRCGSLTARELRLRFLQARDHWFNDECEAKAESFDELITFFCHGLPQIFEEYKSIFRGTTTSIANSKLAAISVSAHSDREDGAIINSWLLLKTSTFILSLEMHLKSLEHTQLITPTLIADTMQKCFKLTDWLASIGFDFSSQLKPLFSKSTISELKFSIERATGKFEAEFTTIISKSIESLLLPVDDEILRISTMRPEEQVPKSIEHYPIFKIYCLHLIDSMRWIQASRSLLSPISLCIDVYGALNASLTRVMNALAVVLNMDNNSNHPILSKIAITFLTEVLPFMTNYCERYFPEKVVLGALGLSKTEFKSICINEPDKVKNFRLDLRQIGHPLRSIMPALMQTIEG